MGKFVTVVIVDDGWDRKRGLDDDGRAYDQGFVSGYFVVDKGANRGEVWRSRLTLLAVITDVDEARRFARKLGDPSELPPRTPARGPPYWQSRALRRLAGDAA